MGSLRFFNVFEEVSSGQDYIYWLKIQYNQQYFERLLQFKITVLLLLLLLYYKMYSCDDKDEFSLLMQGANILLTDRGDVKLGKWFYVRQTSEAAHFGLLYLSLFLSL